MDLSIILPLLVALVPIALFFALVRRRRGTPSGRRQPPAASVSEPAADFGLDRDTDSMTAPAASESSDSGAGAAAAAGGAFIIGVGAARQAGERAASEPDGSGADGGAHRS